MGVSYFLSSLSQSEESNVQRETDYIDDAIKGGLSKEDAQREYDELYPRSRQLMYSYTQAAVEGALSHLSGKILSGKIPGKESDDLINNIDKAKDKLENADANLDNLLDMVELREQLVNLTNNTH